MDAPLCLVVSVLDYAQRPLSYTTTRSVFTPAERVAHTARSIASIRERLPNSEVALVELGRDPVAARPLREFVDRFLYLGQRPLVRRAVESRWKGLGEAVGLTAATRLLPTRPMYYKLSGRYYLTDEFDPEAWCCDGFAFRRYDRDVSTRFYAVAGPCVTTWQRALVASIPRLLLGGGIESALPKHLPATLIRDVAWAGVAGLTAAEGDLLRE